MPSASDELREEMVTRFGCIDTHGPEEFLHSRGWRTDNSNFQPPAGLMTPGVHDNVNLGKIPRDEWNCILFLVHEWDYGTVMIPKS